MTKQLTLFDDEGIEQTPGVGYRAPTVQAIAGVTYRQLDYWARTGLVEPSIQVAAGSGSQRLYSFVDIVVVRTVKRLLDTGLSLRSIRTAIVTLRERAGGADDLAEVTLICDGVNVYQCYDNGEVIDLLSGGQGVFAIALGRTVADVRGSVTAFPAETGVEAGPVGAIDELAERRRRNAS